MIATLIKEYIFQKILEWINFKGIYTWTCSLIHSCSSGGFYIEKELIEIALQTFKNNENYTTVHNYETLNTYIYI